MWCELEADKVFGQLSSEFRVSIKKCDENCARNLDIKWWICDTKNYSPQKINRRRVNRTIGFKASYCSAEKKI